MPALAIVNPHRRGHRKTRARRNPRHRSKAQRAATRRMLAANRSRYGANPRRRSRARRRTFAANPVRHHFRRHYRANPIRHHRRRYRRNPIGADIMPLLKSAAVGAGGAIVVDVLAGYVLPLLPATLNTTTTYPLIKGALAIGFGMAAKKFMSPTMAARMTEGSLVVTLHSFIQSMMPSGITMGSLRYISPATQYIPRLNQNMDQTQDDASQFAGLGMYRAGGQSQFTQGIHGLAGLRALGRLGAYVLPK